MRYATHTEDGRFPKLVQVQEMLYPSLTKKFQYKTYLGSVGNSMRDVNLLFYVHGWRRHTKAGLLCSSVHVLAFPFSWETTPGLYEENKHLGMECKRQSDHPRAFESSKQELKEQVVSHIFADLVLVEDVLLQISLELEQFRSRNGECN